jgi:serine/threonine-protein kinase
MRGQPLAIIHRDVSPQNIIVGIDGMARLIDFGVAKATHRLTQTRSDSLKGKLGYMAPEQIQGMVIDRRVDIFAAGVALHEAITGRRLFHGDNDFDTMRRILDMPIPTPSNLVPGISRELDQVILKALARDPAARYQTAAEFLEALESALPPAPAREVAAYVKLRCGPRMSERRIKLRTLLQGQAPPMTLTPVPPVESGPQTQGSLASTVAPSRSSGAPEQPVDSRVIVAEGTMAASPGRSWAWGLALAAVLLLLVGGVGVAAWKARPRAAAMPAADPVSIAATSTQTAPSVPTATQTPLAPIQGVEIRVTAETTILRVSALGMKRVAITGNAADLVVAPWTGTLEVEALLADGREARALADAKGSHEIRLQPVPKQRPTSGKASRSGGKAGGGKAGGGKAGGGKTGAAGTGDRGELHENPY